MIDTSIPRLAERDLKSFELRPYQRYCVDRIMNSPNHALGLFLGMGAGKTLTVLSSIYEMNDTGNVLIIAPLSVTMNTWQGEIRKYGFPFKTISLVHRDSGNKRPPEERHRMYVDAVSPKHPNIYIATCDEVADMVDNMPRTGMKQIPFDARNPRVKAFLTQIAEGLRVTDVPEHWKWRIHERHRKNGYGVSLLSGADLVLTRTNGARLTYTLSHGAILEPETHWIPPKHNKECERDPQGYMNKCIEEVSHITINTGGQTLWPWPNVVIDEASKFKSYKSTRVDKLMKVRPSIASIIELTGTPRPNSLEELWPLITLLDEGKRLGETMRIYHDRYFDPEQLGDTHRTKWYPKFGSEKTIYDKIDDIAISINNPDLKLPEMVEDDVKIDMSMEEKILYKNMMNNGALRIPVTDENGNPVIDPITHQPQTTDITSANAAVLVGKLLQMAGGTLLVDDTEPSDMTTDDGRRFVILHRRKLDAMQSIVENSFDGVIIAYYFKAERKLIEERLDQMNVRHERFTGSKKQEEAWNAHRIPVILMQPQAGAYGVNYQQGGHDIIWYTLPWSPELYDQTNKRLHRPGQSDRVIIHRLLVRGTVDTRVARALVNKKAQQQTMLNAVSVDAKANATVPNVQVARSATDYVREWERINDFPSDND